MSEFLVLKSTEEQKEEGVEEPVDTAFIEDRDGMPILKASFDIHHFKPDEVWLYTGAILERAQKISIWFEALQLTIFFEQRHSKNTAQSSIYLRIWKVQIPSFSWERAPWCDIFIRGSIIIFECRTNERASSVLSYDQPVA